MKKIIGFALLTLVTSNSFAEVVKCEIGSESDGAFVKHSTCRLGYFNLTQDESGRTVYSEVFINNCNTNDSKVDYVISITPNLDEVSISSRFFKDGIISSSRTVDPKIGSYTFETLSWNNDVVSINVKCQSEDIGPLNIFHASPRR
jgi:hypothetical protein